LIVDTARSPNARLRPLPIASVRLDDQFWAPRLRTVRRASLPQQYEQLETTHRLDSFRHAAGTRQLDERGLVYSDSDVYKWLEAASFALAAEPDAELDRLVDSIVDDVAAAQAVDGYLNTYFTFERASERWSDLSWQHELYTAGHLIQAAVAHHRATAKTRLLEVAVRLADHICATFGPTARLEPDGHPEIEMALVELYRETGRAIYLQRAGFFLDQRGLSPPVLTGQAYMQDHLPVRQQTEIVGHAVRALYLACGMLDVRLETDDATLDPALEALWQSAFTRKAYLTGGLGSCWTGEAFGPDYELPNEGAYAETCAAIAGAMWNWRALLRSPEARFADWYEIALYNGVLAGISLAGTEYFYQNPLADRGQHRRQPWLACACCPPNISRLLLSLPGYLYSTSSDGLWVHQYAQGTVLTRLPGGEPLGLRVQTRYPWDGQVRLSVETTPAVPWTLFLRIPGWCANASVTLDGQPGRSALPAGAYAEIRRVWRAGEALELSLPMPVRRLASHPRVASNLGRVALARGPVVYCVEAADHPDLDVSDLTLPSDAPLTAVENPQLLGGVVTIQGQASAELFADWDGQLYAAANRSPGTAERPVQLTAIPYYAWANRTPGPMQVWLRAH
jgi:DUF1680 family protein